MGQSGTSAKDNQASTCIKETTITKGRSYFLEWSNQTHSPYTH